MNTQIIITPAGVLWVAGAIVSISAAAGVLIRIYKHFRKPGETQDHRIAELAAGAHVGVTLPAKPLSSVGQRQQGPPFLALPAPMLASPSRQSLCLPSSHANKARPFPRRQQDLPFPALPAPMLASPCPQSLNPSSGHANKARPFPRRRRPCWRRPPGRALILRRGTPTRPALSRAAGSHVGVALPAKP